PSPRPATSSGGGDRRLASRAIDHGESSTPSHPPPYDTLRRAFAPPCAGARSYIMTWAGRGRGFDVQFPVARAASHGDTRGERREPMDKWPSKPPVPIMMKAIRSRDASFDGLFFTGVKSTEIFCRPSCPARAPLARNIEFFGTIREALFAGY